MLIYISQFGFCPLLAGAGLCVNAAADYPPGPGPGPGVCQAFSPDLKLSSKWICSVKCSVKCLGSRQGWTRALSRAGSQNAKDITIKPNKTDPSHTAIRSDVLFTNAPALTLKALLKVSSQCRYISLIHGIRKILFTNEPKSPPYLIFFKRISIYIFVSSVASIIASLTRIIAPLCRSTPRAVISRLTSGRTPVRSPTCAAGRVVTGSLRGQMSWPDIIGNTPGVNPSSVISVTEHSPGVTTSASTWRGTR